MWPAYLITYCHSIIPPLNVCKCTGHTWILQLQEENARLRSCVAELESQLQQTESSKLQLKKRSVKSVEEREPGWLEVCPSSLMYMYMYCVHLLWNYRFCIVNAYASMRDYYTQKKHTDTVRNKILGHWLSYNGTSMWRSWAVCWQAPHITASYSVGSGWVAK